MLFLLNGVADENQSISQGCIQFLEEHGNRMRDALRQLGEEDTEMKLWASRELKSNLQSTVFNLLVKLHSF